MASQPQRSYKNAAVLPPETKVSIYVDLPPIIHNRSFPPGSDTRTLSEDYILRCFAQAMYLSAIPTDTTLWSKFLMHSKYEEALGTFVYEDMTLREMKSPDNPSSKKLEANLKWIGDTLKCNVSVFVGHVDTCQNYIDTIYKKTIEQIRFFTSLPTIFLIIACRGDEMAYKLNTETKYDVFRQNKIVFFGFEDLLHIHEGEIYSTKLFDTKRSKAICDSEEMVSLFHSFDTDMAAAGIVSRLPVTPEHILEIYRHHPDFEIFKCCKAKLGRLYSDFVKGLERRETTKYSKELLAKKFKVFIESPQRQTLTKANTTITSVDGIDCAKEDCAIPNLYEEDERLAQNYNQKGAFHTLFRELKSLMVPNHTYTNGALHSEEDHKATVEQFFKKIQGLKGKDMSVFTYTPNIALIPPILFELLQFDFPFGTAEYPFFPTIRFILQKYGQSLDLSMEDPYTGESILHEIISSLNFDENQKYILFKTIYDVLKTDKEKEKIFFLQDKEGNIALTKERNSLLYFFYIDKFGPLLPSVTYNVKGKTGNLLHRILDFYISPNNTEEDTIMINIVRGLLQVGVNPNQKLIEDIQHPYAYGGTDSTYKPLELYTSLYIPPYNLSLFDIFLQYGMTNDDRYFTMQQQFYEQLETIVTKRESFKIVVGALEEFVDSKPYIERQRGGGWHNNNNNNYNHNHNNNYCNNDSRNNPEERILENLETNEERDIFLDKVTLYKEYQYRWYSFKKNIQLFKSSPMKIIKETNELYKRSLQQRKGVQKHGSKVRKTYKANKERLNKTIKNKLNTISFNMNGEKMIGDLVGKILELAKRKEFTKEEKANYKKRPITVSKSNLQPREKYDSLKEIYEQMEAVLKTR